MIPQPTPSPTHVRQAKLDDGSIVYYDYCSSDRHSETFDNEVFTYLGHGEVYMINGVPQNGTRKNGLHFFKRNAV